MLYIPQSNDLISFLVPSSRLESLDLGLNSLEKPVKKKISRC